jgi:phosphoglycolate phosphatase
MYDVMLFDFDGTIANTLAASVSIYNEIAQRDGFVPIEDLEAARRISLREFFKRSHIPLRKLPRMTREFITRQRAALPNVELFEGYRAVLPELNRRCRLGIVSSNAKENIEFFLKSQGVGEYFEWIIGVQRIVGKGRAISRLLRRLKVAPARCVYVGDELRDIEAARKARTASVAVPWGFQSIALLEKANPTHIVVHPSQLLELVAETRERETP